MRVPPEQERLPGLAGLLGMSGDGGSGGAWRDTGSPAVCGSCAEPGRTGRSRAPAGAIPLIVCTSPRILGG